uniref:Ig-like domain-containing protein n=1 Tax=Sinocyclocheilus grahami TaxID=75366 RepID=A0A672L2M8_SINGR
CLCSSENHYLHYMFTALTKEDVLPEYSAVGVVDDRRISDNSNEVPDWIRLILTADDETDALVQLCDSNWYKHQLYTLSNCTKCSELHTFRRIIGCEVEKFPDGTVKSLRAFDEYGFDGEDFITFDSDTLQWIVKSPKAKETKKKWDQQTERNQFIKNYVEKCMDWISTFNNTHENSPDVYISARRAPDDHSKLVLSCLATGFYPRDIEMYIRLNESVLDNQTSSGIRPNANETFQMNTSVEIDINYKGSYDCFVIHSSLTEPVSIEWGKYHHKHTLIVILWWCGSKKKGSNGEL